MRWSEQSTYGWALYLEGHAHREGKQCFPSGIVKRGRAFMRRFKDTASQAGQGPDHPQPCLGSKGHRVACTTESSTEDIELNASLK